MTPIFTVIPLKVLLKSRILGEIAFHYALETNDSAVKVIHCVIARESVATILDRLREYPCTDACACEVHPMGSLAILRKAVTASSLSTK